MVMRSVVWSRVGRLVPCAALALLTLASSEPAQARYRHYFYRQHGVHHQRARPARYAAEVAGVGSNFAAMVVDANSGKTLYAVNEDAPRHPASITKVMTLFLLFEELDKGSMRLDTPLTVSSHAAAQSPTKLGLRPGATITVENAIKAIVTKSANDMAVAVAENIAGDEGTFAQAMTRKARSLGMNHTDYVNASGLPDNRQITTARDLTILGRAIRERFPRYYRYFSTTSFTYAGSYMPNHNHLLGPRRRHGRDQDRIYQRLRVQPADLGQPGRPAYRVGGARRPHGREPRSRDADAHRGPYRGGFGDAEHPHRRRDADRGTRRGAEPYGEPASGRPSAAPPSGRPRPRGR